MKKQTTGKSRNTIDKFYTKKEIVQLCIEKSKSLLKIDKKDIIIEPSAGNGSFIENIKQICDQWYAFDIMPEHPEIIQQNYLEFNYQKIRNLPINIHVIGNPPFGRQSSLALKFIKHSSMFCDSISFILPKSFKKNSLKDKISLQFHCIFEMDLPNNSFLMNKKEYNVPCVFQIWQKQETKREKTKKMKPKNYEFVKKEQEHDISFRRVGVYAGKVDIDTEKKSIQSHYFIKFHNGLFTSELLNKLKNINYSSRDYTVGPKSIGKQELIKEFNMIL